MENFERITKNGMYSTKIEMIRVKKNMGGKVFVRKQTKLTGSRFVYRKFKRLFKQRLFSQHHLTKLPMGPNHLKGRGVAKWGLWLQCEWELRPGKVNGEENVNE